MANSFGWMNALLLCSLSCIVLCLQQDDASQVLDQKIAQFKLNLHRTFEGARIRKKRQLQPQTPNPEEHLRVGSSFRDDLPYLSNYNLTFWIPVRHRSSNQVLIGTKEGHLVLFEISQLDDKLATLIAVSLQEDVSVKAKAYSHFDEQWFAIMQRSQNKHWIRLYQKIGRGLERRQTIVLEEESDFDLISLRGIHYLAVATFRRKTSQGFTEQANVALYHWTRSQFDLIASRPTYGARTIACWVLDGTLYLVVGQETGPKGSLYIGSPVYLFNAKEENALVLLDLLHMVGPKKVLHFSVAGSHYIIFIGRQDAFIYWWSSNQFLQWQSIVGTASATDVSILSLENGEVVIIIALKEEVLFLTLDDSGHYVVSFTMKFSGFISSLQFMFSGRSYYALALFAAAAKAKEHAIWKLGFDKYAFPKKSSLDTLRQCLYDVKEALQERQNELNMVNFDLHKVWLKDKEQKITTNVIIEGLLESQTPTTSVADTIIIRNGTNTPWVLPSELSENMVQIVTLSDAVKSAFKNMVLKSSDQEISGTKRFTGSLTVPSINMESAKFSVNINGVPVTQLSQHGLRNIGDQKFTNQVQMDDLYTDVAAFGSLNGLNLKDLLLRKGKQNVTGSLKFANVNTGSISIAPGGSVNSILVDHLFTTRANQQIKELKSFSYIKAESITVHGETNGEDFEKISKKMVKKFGVNELSGRTEISSTFHVAGDLFLPGLINAAVDLSRLALESVTKATTQQIQGPVTLKFPINIRGNLETSGLINGIDTRRLLTLHTNQTVTGNMNFTAPITIEGNIPNHLVNGIDLDHKAILKNSDEPQFAQGLKTFLTSFKTNFIEMTDFVKIDGIDPSELSQDIIRHNKGVVRHNGTTFQNVVVLGNVTTTEGVNGFSVSDIPEVMWLKSKPQIIKKQVFVNGPVLAEDDLEVTTVNTINLNTDVLHSFGDEIVVSKKTFEYPVRVAEYFNVSIEKTINGADLSTFTEDYDTEETVQGVKIMKYLEVFGDLSADSVNDLDVQRDVMLFDRPQTVTSLKEIVSPVKISNSQMKLKSVDFATYNGKHLKKYFKNAVLTSNNSPGILKNKTFAQLKAKNLNLSNKSKISGVSLPEMLLRTVTLNLEQLISGKKIFSSNIHISKPSIAATINGIDIVNLFHRVVKVDVSETVNSAKEFSGKFSTADLLVKNRINNVDILELASYYFSKSGTNVILAPFIFMNDADIGKVATETINGITWDELYFLNRDETLGPTWIMAHAKAYKDMFITGTLNGCDLTQLGYYALYSKNNEKAILGELNLESVTVIGNIHLSNDINEVSLRNIQSQVITLSGDQVLDGNILIKNAMSIGSLIMKDKANPQDLSFMLIDAVRHYIPQAIRGYKMFRNDLTATAFTGNDLLLLEALNDVDVNKMIRQTVWKTGFQIINGEKSLAAAFANNVTVREYLNGLRIPEDVFQTWTSEHIWSPIYIMKDMIIKTNLTVYGRIDDVMLDQLVENRVTLSGAQKLKSKLTVWRDVVIGQLIINGMINDVVLDMVASVRKGAILDGKKKFATDVVMFRDLKAKDVNGYNLHSLMYNILKYNSNETLDAYQYFVQPLHVLDSLLAYSINHIPVIDFKKNFAAQSVNINATLGFFNELNQLSENRLVQQLKTSSSQISSFAHFVLIQEIDLGPSNRILHSYRLDHQGSGFSHSMVIWTTESHCIYQERCCHVDYSYWIRVKNNGMVVRDSDAERGKYFPVYNPFQATMEQEFVIWTNASARQPSWCSSMGRDELQISAFAESGRLEVFLNVLNAPTLSDVKIFRDGHLFAVVGFFYDRRNNEHSSSVVYAYNQRRREWTEHQILPTFGVLSMDIAVTNLGNEIFLALGTGLGTYPDSYSTVYKWNDVEQAFKVLQNIPSQYVTSTLWVEKDRSQFLILAGVDYYPMMDSECSARISGGQMDVYVFNQNLTWIQSIPLGGVISMVSFTVEGEVYIAAASSQMQAIVIFQWEGYSRFRQIQTIFSNDVRHLNAYWIEDQFYLAVASDYGPVKIFRAILRGKNVLNENYGFQIIGEQKDEPEVDQKFISGC